MKASDLMVQVDASLRPDDELREYVEKIRIVRSSTETPGARALPVLDASGKPIGVLSMKDILKAIYPPYLYNADLSLFTWDGMLESLARHISGKRVSEIMSSPVITVRGDHSLMECVDHMLKHGISTIAVVDRTGRFIGMIYECQLFFAIAEALTGGNKA
jgi:CBS-domain-containing membrane protein